MGCLGNVIWLFLGGLETAAEYFLAGLVLCLTIVGIPFGLQAFKIGFFCLWPFGSQVSGNVAGSGCLTTLFNILWFCFAGIWIALTHAFFGLLLCVTVIGIPWGMVQFRLAGLALCPFGKDVSLSL